MADRAGLPRRPPAGRAPADRGGGVLLGLTEGQRRGFGEAYGYDMTSWPGYPVLRDMRELQTLTAVLRNAHRDPRAHEELKLRLASLRAGDDRLWNAF